MRCRTRNLKVLSPGGSGRRWRSYGEEALRNVSLAVTGRLKEERVRECREWRRSDLGTEDWLYVWADAVYLRCAGARTSSASWG